jgi:general secretion pathway protein G
MGRVIAMLVLVVAMGGHVEARSNRLAGDMILIGAALKMFKMHAGRYPAEEEGLMALVERPATYPDDKRWQRVMDRPPLDPWGQPYHYIILTNPSPRKKEEVLWLSASEGIGLYSCGPDGISNSRGNDPDDYNTWDESCWDKRSFHEKLWDSPAARYFGIAVVVIAGIWVLSRWQGRLYQTP